MSTEFYLVAAVLTSIISASRFTRLATVDKFPPILAIRDWYEEKTDGSDWQFLTLCGYCFSFWAALGVVLWGYFAGVYETQPTGADISMKIWWLVNGTMSIAYLAGIFMAYDGDDDDDEDDFFGVLSKTGDV